MRCSRSSRRTIDTVGRSLMDGKPIQGGSQIGKSLAAMADKLVEARDKESKEGECQERLALHHSFVDR